MAKIISDGEKDGPYLYRVRFPKGRVVHAHSHPYERIYTVLTGTWYIGRGDIYDETKSTSLPAGSVYIEPAGKPHFVATPEAEAVVQITGTGPTKIDYVDFSQGPVR